MHGHTHSRAPGYAGRAWLQPPVHGRTSLLVGRALFFLHPFALGAFGPLFHLKMHPKCLIPY